MPPGGPGQSGGRQVEPAQVLEVREHRRELLTTRRRDRQGPASALNGRLQPLHATRWDVVRALGLAGLVNIAMLLLAVSGLGGVPGADMNEGAQAAVGAPQPSIGP